MELDQEMNVCHLISGDLWAGAEVQMYTISTILKSTSGLNYSAIVLNDGKLAEKLKTDGIEVIIIDEQKYNIVQIYYRLKKILKDRDIDILHTHRYKENILGALMKRKGIVKYLVQTVHGGSEPFGGIKKINGYIYDALNIFFSRKYFDNIIAVSNDLHRQLAKVYPASKLVTFHNAVDPGNIKPTRSPQTIRDEFNIDSKAPLIGATGRMVPVKAYHLFLKMAQIIVERRPDAKFMLVGDGPLKQQLQELSQQLGITQNVIFPGFRDDIIDVMSAFDIFVISSHHEGVPMALLEAMSLKKAIVSTAVGGINEVIENNVSGLLVQPESPQTLAESCLRIIEDDSLKHRLESATAKRIEDEFSIDILKNKIVVLYGELTKI